MKLKDEKLAEQLAQRRAAAATQLWAKMEERGMTREGGWNVAEFTRDTREGTELVVRPVHLWHQSPYDLEQVVWIDIGDGVIEPSCTPEPMRRDLSPRP
jgi:hypothetical protein